MNVAIINAFGMELTSEENPIGREHDDRLIAKAIDAARELLSADLDIGICSVVVMNDLDVAAVVRWNLAVAKDAKDTDDASPPIEVIRLAPAVHHEPGEGG